jgi:uncharacterized protein YdeI (YjbR/CyaY-like superfamily)
MSRSTQTRMNPKVDAYLRKSKKWQKEFEKLRMIVLDCQLTEELKWGHPCYTFQKKNIVVIHGFKEYCALLFFKGALLKEKNKGVGSGFAINDIAERTDAVDPAGATAFRSSMSI